SIHIDDIWSESDDPRVRYLSQQFVDQLCSSDGLAENLVSEIERVIFEAHAADARLGSRNFDELREIKTDSIHRRMEKYQEELRRKRAAERVDIDRMKSDRTKITPTDNKPLLERLEMVRAAAEQKSHEIAKLERKELKLNALKDEVKQFKDSESIMQLNQLK